MNARQICWSDVQVGMYVQDKDSKTWRVDDEREQRLLLAAPDGALLAIDRPPPAARVVVLEPTHDEALAVVTEKLGAEVLATKPDDEPVFCPPLPHRLQSIHTHFFLMHGVFTASGPGSKSIPKLLEGHKEDHLSDIHAGRFIPHEHH